MNRVSRDLRIAVVGAAGSKAFSALLARHLDIPQVALGRFEAGSDAAVLAPGDDSHDLSTSLGDSWIIDGNSDTARELLWPKATTIVWLDFWPSLTVGHQIRKLAGALFTPMSKGVALVRRVYGWLRPARAALPGTDELEVRRALYSVLLDTRWVRLQSLTDTREWLRDVGR